MTSQPMSPLPVGQVLENQFRDVHPACDTTLSTDPSHEQAGSPASTLSLTGSHVSRLTC
jgi:hypothetical protein